MALLPAEGKELGMTVRTGIRHATTLRSSRYFEVVMINLFGEEVIPDCEGHTQDSSKHWFCWTGKSMPCTGVQKCQKCGIIYDEKADAELDALDDEIEHQVRIMHHPRKFVIREVYGHGFINGQLIDLSDQNGK